MKKNWGEGEVPCKKAIQRVKEDERDKHSDIIKTLRGENVALNELLKNSYGQNFQVKMENNNLKEKIKQDTIYILKTSRMIMII